jgi:hypothetical protein
MCCKIRCDGDLEIFWELSLLLQKLKIFQDFSLHRIFRRIHGVLKINKNKKLIVQFGRN